VTKIGNFGSHHGGHFGCVGSHIRCIYVHTFFYELVNVTNSFHDHANLVIYTKIIILRMTGTNKWSKTNLLAILATLMTILDVTTVFSPLSAHAPISAPPLNVNLFSSQVYKPHLPSPTLLGSISAYQLRPKIEVYKVFLVHRPPLICLGLSIFGFFFLFVEPFLRTIQRCFMLANLSCEFIHGYSQFYFHYFYFYAYFVI
jgi:hypothetical protein